MDSRRLSGRREPLGRLVSVAPDVISCETHMLPAKRRNVRDDRGRDIEALALEFNKRLFEVACISLSGLSIHLICLFLQLLLNL